MKTIDQELQTIRQVVKNSIEGKAPAIYDFAMSICDRYDKEIRRLLASQRDDFQTRIDAILSFSQGQGWRGEEAFRMIERELEKLSKSLADKKEVGME